jgi:hypothetical protein
MAARRSTKAPEAKPEYERTPREAAAVEKLRRERVRSPRLKISKSENGVKDIRLDHPDRVAGYALLMEATATTDQDFATHFLGQLAGAGADEKETNFMLSVVEGIKPQDQIEAMLAAQMAAVHVATMRFSHKLAEAQLLEHRDSAERTFNKLTRTFVAQTDALKRYRTGGEQKVTVQHVNVSEGGQAIVGNVTQGQRDATPNGNAAPHLALTHDRKQPMPVIESKKTASLPALRNANKSDGRSSTQYDADAFEPTLRR